MCGTIKESWFWFWNVLAHALLFFISLLISSLSHGQWWGIFLCCCCFLFSIDLSLILNISDQVRAASVPARERGTAHNMLREGEGLIIDASQTLPLALIDCVDSGAVDSSNQITATGWSHRQWIFTQLICIWFYYQIIMTILGNMTKNSYRLQL